MTNSANNFADDDDAYWNMQSKHSTVFKVFDDESRGESETAKALAELKKRQDDDKDTPVDSVETVGCPVSFNASTSSLKSIDSFGQPSRASSFVTSTQSNSDRFTPKPQTMGHQKNASIGSIGASSVSSVSLEEAIRSSAPKKEYSQADYTRLNEEYKRLVGKFEVLKHDKYKRADVVETMTRMKHEKPFILESFKSQRSKMELLEAVMKFGDGDLICQVLLFLKNTLSFALFQEQLLKNSIAANHYLSYLREHFKWDELTTTLLSLGRKEEAAMVEFRLAFKKSSASAKIFALKQCIKSTMGSDSTLVNECQLTTEYVNLLERQQPIDEFDDKTIESGREAKFKQIPKTTSIVDQSVLTTLYYCSLYHYDLPQNSYASPLAVRQQHNLSDKQFCWIAVRALARQKRWNDIQQLLINKNLFGSTKLKMALPPAKLVTILSHNGANEDTLSIFLRLVDDNDLKLQLATKFKCHTIVVDHHVTMKDRVSLIEYKSKLSAHTKEAYYAEAALNNSSTKWKN